MNNSRATDKPLVSPAIFETYKHLVNSTDRTVLGKPDMEGWNLSPQLSCADGPVKLQRPPAITHQRSNRDTAPRR